MISVKQLRPILCSLVLTLPGLSACTAIYEADRASRDLFDPIEGMPGWAKTMEKQSWAEVYDGPSGWSEYEIGRRFENGIGVDKDTYCAVYWYWRASISSYEVEDTVSPGRDANRKPYMVKYSDGLPRARNALKRLKAAGVPVDEDIARARNAAILREGDTCRLKVEALARGG
ncbi:MAG: hypothetical protein QM667_10485 [Asticcacaulis sp.]